MTLAETLSKLADATRERFNVNEPLGLNDIIKLITPPSVIELFTKNSFRLTNGITGGGNMINLGTRLALDFMNNVNSAIVMNKKKDCILDIQLYISDDFTGSTEVIFKDPQGKQLDSQPFHNHYTFYFSTKVPKGTLTKPEDLMYYLCLNKGGSCWISWDKCGAKLTAVND